MTLLYTFQGVFLVAENVHNQSNDLNMSGLIENPDEIPEYQNYTSEEDIQGGVGIDPLNIITGFLSFIFLQAFPSMPVFAKIILGIVATILMIITTLLVYQFIRDWIPFV